jgi:Domain of unknown function DUF29
MTLISEDIKQLENELAERKTELETLTDIKGKEKSEGELVIRKELSRIENELAKKKSEFKILKDTLSCDKKEQLRDHLIMLMIPVISWEKSPGIKTSEWAVSIIKGRHLIEDFLLKDPSFDKKYIQDIWDICFERARGLEQADIGINKHGIPIKKPTWQEVFEKDYKLTSDEAGAHLKNTYNKEIMTLLSFPVALIGLSISVNVSTLLPKTGFFEFISSSLIVLSIFLLIMVVGMMAVKSLFKPLLLGIAFLLATFLSVIMIFSPSPKPNASTASQSSDTVQPSSSPKPGFTEPSQNSQNIHQKSNK